MEELRRKGDELFGRDGLLPLLPLGLEVLDIFGKRFQEAEIEPGGRPDNPLLVLRLGHVLGHVHGSSWVRWMEDSVVMDGCSEGWCQVSPTEREGETRFFKELDVERFQSCKRPGSEKQRMSARYWLHEGLEANPTVC